VVYGRTRTSALAIFLLGAAAFPAWAQDHPRFARPGEKVQQLARAVPQTLSNVVPNAVTAIADQAASGAITGWRAAGRGTSEATEVLAGAARSPDPQWLAEGARRATNEVRNLREPTALWKASLVALVAASAVDAHSSWGKLEANAVIAGSDGRFGARSLGMKVGLTGVVLVVQHWVIKKDARAARGLTIANAALAAVHAGVAAHNYGNSRPNRN
jgi:hypothetical protein